MNSSISAKETTANGRRPYVRPDMRVIEMSFKTALLSSSSSSPDTDDECDNPWWCDRQPSPDDWWGK